MGPAGFLLYALLPYVGAYAGARSALGGSARELRPGRVTTALVAVVGLPSLVGLVVPAVRQALERDADRIAHGEVWRLATALVQQDGGIPGTVANLAALLVVGSVAEHLLGGRRTLVVFVGVGVLAQLPALAWQPVGAGNSVADLGVAGAVAADVLLSGPRSRPAVAAAALVLVAGIALTAVRDLHGPAVLLGAAACAISRRVPGSPDLVEP